MSALGGKVALVTGASSGLGAQFAKTLAGVDRAKIVKYYPEGGMRPRSAYAQSMLPQPGASQGGDINLIQIRAGSMGPFGNVGFAGAYYLWMPPG